MSSTVWPSADTGFGLELAAAEAPATTRAAVSDSAREVALKQEVEHECMQIHKEALMAERQRLENLVREEVVTVELHPADGEVDLAVAVLRALAQQGWLVNLPKFVTLQKVPTDFLK